MGKVYNSTIIPAFTVKIHGCTRASRLDCSFTRETYRFDARKPDRAILQKSVYDRTEIPRQKSRMALTLWKTRDIFDSFSTSFLNRDNIESTIGYAFERWLSNFKFVTMEIMFDFFRKRNNFIGKIIQCIRSIIII